MGKTTAKPVTINGVHYPSVTAMCKALNICSTTYRQRIDIDGMSPEQAVAAKTRRPASHPAPRIYGVKYTSITEALEAFGVPRDLYRERRAKGWEIITAIIGPTELGAEKQDEPHFARDKLWPSEKAMRKEYGVSEDIYQMRLSREWPRSRACCLPEIITNARVPMMFPDELRRVMNTYVCESSLQGGPDRCMIWPGQLAKSGFIEVYAMRKRYSVPRLVYCMEHDVHPNDLSARISVTQACGNVRCIAPGHMVAVLNRRRNNWKGPRPPDQPVQDEEDLGPATLPPEVLASARKLMATGWMDIGATAKALQLDVKQLRAELGLK